MLEQNDIAGRLALVYDTRDNEYNTHQGLLLEAGTQVGSGNDGYNFFDGRSSWWAEHRVERINLGGNMKRKWTQTVRAIILLEHIGTPDAVAILRDMATGHPDAQPTKLAAEALERLPTKSP